MILVIDNHDSFTWNAVHELIGLGAEVTVVRNDAISVGEALARGTRGILLSPGPGTPDRSGITLPMVLACAAARRPLLGLCLGHQALAMAYGGTIVRAPAPVHGKTCPIAHDGSGLFAGLPDPVDMIRYNSLMVDAAGLDPALRINATAPDGTIQGLAHRSLPLHSVQFHPESIGSPLGSAIFRNFLALAS